MDFKKEASPRELRWFGAGIVLFAAIVCGVLFLQGVSPATLRLVMGLAAGVTFVYYAVPPTRRWIYLTWMAAAYPIGWVVSHALLAAIYYLIVTPIGLLMRVTVRDPVQRRFDPTATTYWVEHDPAAGGVRRYFKQY